MARQPEVRYINYYVSGNIAYQPEKSPKTRTRTQLPAMPKAQKQLHTIDRSAALCVVVAAVLLIALAVSAVQFVSAKEEVAQLQHYVASLQKENQMLEQTYVEAFDPEQIKTIADSLGMIPVEDAKHMIVQVQLPVEEQEPTVWESFLVFLKGLFA